MKIRNGFVSNSSSSSFIIAFKGIPEIDLETKTKYPFLENIFKKYEDLLSRNGDIVRTVAALDKYFIAQYGYKEDSVQQVISEDEWLTEKYNDLISKLVKGFSLIFTEVDYFDEVTAELYRSLDDGVNFIVEGD